MLEQEHWEIIHTPEFKRLKNIKQLGPTWMNIPDASHSRFEHCIGTYNVARDLIEILKFNQGNEIEFDHFYTRNVMTAALSHDLGHGPFSHTFDNNFMQKRFPELNWCHEKCSVDLFEYMIDRNNIELYEKEDIQMVQDLIIGKPSRSSKFLNLCVNLQFYRKFSFVLKFS